MFQFKRKYVTMIEQTCINFTGFLFLIISFFSFNSASISITY